MDYIFCSRVPVVWRCYLAYHSCLNPSLTTPPGDQETPKDARRQQTTLPVLGTPTGTERYGLRTSPRGTPYIPSSTTVPKARVNNDLDAPRPLDLLDPPTQTQHLAPPRKPPNPRRIHETPLQARNIPPHRVPRKLPKPLRVSNIQLTFE
jgi:hypothetical protein